MNPTDWSKSQQLLFAVALFVAGILVAALVSGQAGTISGVAISASGLIFPLVVELYKASNEIRGLTKSIIQEIHKALQEILKALSAHTLDLDSKFRDEPDYREYLETGKTLLAAASGVDFVEHMLMLQRMGDTMDHYYHDFPDQYDEELRINVLADIIMAAQHFVWAYTYADHDHLTRFWGKSGEQYYTAHERAMARRSRTGSDFELSRVFVLPKNFPQKPEDLPALLETFDRLRKAKVSDISWLREDEARRALADKRIDFPMRSFFLAGDKDGGGGAISEGAARVRTVDIDLDEKLLKVIRTHGWILTPEGMRTREAFKRIRQRKRPKRISVPHEELETITLPGYVLFSQHKASLKEFREQFVALKRAGTIVSDKTKDDLNELFRA